MTSFAMIWFYATNWPYLLPLVLGATDPQDPNMITLNNFFDNLRKDIVGLALGVAGVCFAMSAVLYSTAGHNERRVEGAKLSLYAALVGLVLALLSDVIVQIVQAATGK